MPEFQNEIYCDGYREFLAVFLSWHDVETILGHPHTGDPEDDELLTRWLQNNGAPDWVDDTREGWIDENGWGLIGPPTE